MVVWPFLAEPWVCLRFVIVVFPDHTLLLFLAPNCTVLGAQLALGENSLVCFPEYFVILVVAWLYLPVMNIYTFLLMLYASFSSFFFFSCLPSMGSCPEF